MALFRPRRRSNPVRQFGVLDEFERMFRSARALPLAAPILLIIGLSAGQVTNRALAVSGDEPIRTTTEKDIPRIHLDALSARMHAMNDAGERTVAVMTRYREDVKPVETVLRRHGVGRKVARQIAWPLVEEAGKKQLDPATVVAVVLVESEGKPTAKSFVGARGLMQVMPLWIGTWRECGRDLFNIADNLCNGTSILRWYLRQRGSEREALLGYNGCVNGTNTPRCHTYPDKVWRLREQIRKEISSEKAKIQRQTD
jgi:soluble lytic murein transglycosylase-like protein